MKIVACVVTRNRLGLLRDCIKALRNQTRRLDSIIVVDNESSDGTGAWLSGEVDLQVIPNSNSQGCAGGFKVACLAAYNTGADQIWLMDDDVEAKPNCLEELLSGNLDNVRQPLRRNLANEVCCYDPIRLNLINPFRLFHLQLITPEAADGAIFEIGAFPFEGPIFPRSLISAVGYPNSAMFICGDDTEYSLRVITAGYKIYMNPKAELIRKLEIASLTMGLNWKDFYMLRNMIYIDQVFGSVSVRAIRWIRYLVSYLRRCRSFKEIKLVLMAVKDALARDLKVSVKPGSF